MGLTLEEELNEQGKPVYVIVHGDGDLDELISIIDFYKAEGFNKAWHGDENSTLCIGKV